MKTSTKEHAMKNGYALSQTAGAKLESAVNRNELASVAGKMFEWVATGENMKLLAELMNTKSSNLQYWHEYAVGEKIQDVLFGYNADDNINYTLYGSNRDPYDISCIGHRDLKKVVSGEEIAEMWGLRSLHPNDGFKRHVVTLEQIRQFHLHQSSPQAQLLVSAPRETHWNVFPVIVGHAYAVFVRYGAGGETTIKAGNWVDMKWDPGTRIFSRNQFSGSLS